ncbi:unnamed protein product [Trichobilharzia szidati]|nr:unnamed protein product [Trichobilharzia szidati]
MSGSKRGRKSVMGLDLTNIIDSPPGSADSSGTRRRSLRLRRKSTCAVSHDEQTLPSRRYRRKSVIDPQTQTDAVYDASCNSSHSPAQNEKNVPCTDIFAQPCCTASPDKVSVLSQDELENVRPQSPPHIPSDIKDVYLPNKYTPPKHRGLPTILENSVEKNQRCHRLCRNTERSPLRRQIFTGQTLEEACIPTAPGVAPLDPDLVLSTTRKRIAKRRRLAKKLGFKGITISKKTENRFSKFLLESALNSSHSSSTSD